MEPIKEAFTSVKKDMDSIKQELSFLRSNLFETRNSIIELCEVIKNIQNSLNLLEKQQKTPNLSVEATSTHRQINQTDSTHISTDSTHIKPLKGQNQGISTGNRGASTDRQTDRQTHENSVFTPKSSYNPPIKPEKDLDNALEVLNSLDNIKKEIRLKFKNLTEQEMLVFSAIYQIEEEDGFADYKSISMKLHLTESSIRDYTRRLIKKGIPVEKTRVNNKQIQLNISQNLRKIAPLSTILQLRDI